MKEKQYFVVRNFTPYGSSYVLSVDMIGGSEDNVGVANHFNMQIPIRVSSATSSSGVETRALFIAREADRVGARVDSGIVSH